MMGLYYILGVLLVFVVGVLMGMNLGWDMAHDVSPLLKQGDDFASKGKNDGTN